MPQVTVDAKDLEALIFGTAGLKGVAQACQSALKVADNDPLVQNAKPDFELAHDRLAKAWREAQRRETRPEIFRDPTPHELQAMVDLYQAGALGKRGQEISVRSARYSQLRALLLTGMAEYGAAREAVMWGSSGEVAVTDFPEVQRVRLTPRGRDMAYAEIERRELERLEKERSDAEEATQASSKEGL